MFVMNLSNFVLIIEKHQINCHQSENFNRFKMWELLCVINILKSQPVCRQCRIHQKLFNLAFWELCNHLAFSSPLLQILQFWQIKSSHMFELESLHRKHYQVGHKAYRYFYVIKFYTGTCSLVHYIWFFQSISLASQNWDHETNIHNSVLRK